MATNELYDLIIIGGGPGGLTAGIYAMRGALKTLLIEKAMPGGQVMLSDEVENWPGTEHISGAELSMKFAQHAQSYGLEIVQQEVSRIEPGLNYHTVKLSDGQEFKTLSLILGMGGSPRKLGIPGEEDYYGKGVSYCAVCDGFFFRDKTVVVVGGGDSATEESLYLAKLAKQVHIIHRRDELRASMILQERVNADCKINIIWNTIPKEIKANDEGVYAISLENVKTKAREDLPADGVFIFIGFEPNNQIVPAGIQMDANGYVVTDHTCLTALPGIYAIGDLRQKYARQIVISAADGCTAALSAAHYVETRKASPDYCELPADLA